MGLFWVRTLRPWYLCHFLLHFDIWDVSAITIIISSRNASGDITANYYLMDLAPWWTLYCQRRIATVSRHFCASISIVNYSIMTIIFGCLKIGFTAIIVESYEWFSLKFAFNIEIGNRILFQSWQVRPKSCTLLPFFPYPGPFSNCCICKEDFGVVSYFI